MKMAMRDARSRNRAGKAPSIEKPLSADIFISCGFGVSWPEGSGTKLAVHSFALHLQALLW